MTFVADIDPLAMEPHRGRLTHQFHCPCYHTRPQPSTPIEIPTRRRPTQIIQSPPSNVAASPELIFDMSPLEYSIDSVLSTSRPAAFSTFKSDQTYTDRGALLCIDSTESKSSLREPFLYSFPMLASHEPPSNSDRSDRSKLAPSRDVISGTPTSPPGEDRRDVHCLDLLEFNSDGEHSPSFLRANAFLRPPGGAFGEERTQRTIGFPPQKRLPCYVRNRQSPPLPLSLFQSRGTGGTCSFGGGTSLSYSPQDTNNGSFGFEGYLFRRIDDGRPVRVSHTQPITSARLSVRS